MRAKRILAICMVMLLVALAWPLVASADTAQTWYLFSSNGPPDVMYKGDTSQSAGTETVADGFSNVWRADEAASMHVNFPSGTWSGMLSLDSVFPEGESFTIEIGTWSGSSFTSATDPPYSIDGDGGDWYVFSFTADAFTVLENQWLAFKIDNPAAGDADLVVKTGQNYSRVKSPAADPGYPIPELPTIVLLATGLVGLAAYLGFKRRERVYLKA
ncbi:MAG: hypothetical protein ACE5NJ_12220 [Thermodesulfobacteriota bacterium]